MLIAAIGDAHIGSDGFSELRRADFIRQFDHAILRAVEYGAACIVLLGDVFDRTIDAGDERWWETCVAEVACSLERPRRLGIRVFAVPGNNDQQSCPSYQGLLQLADEGYLTILDDAAILLNNIWLCGISWKATEETFRDVVDRLALQVEKKRAILCIHQLVSGSTYTCEKELIVDETTLSGWKAVFAGHNHIHQEHGTIYIPGALEIRNLIDAIAEEKKGIVLYNTESGITDFVPIPLSRAVRYVKFDVSGRPQEVVYRDIREWITRMSSEGTLLLINLRGNYPPETRGRIPLEEFVRTGLKKGYLVTFLDRVCSENSPY